MQPRPHHVTTSADRGAETGHGANRRSGRTNVSLVGTSGGARTNDSPRLGSGSPG
jgi:hypothetical protein